jgi:RNA recognition motif-containing protein
MVAEGPIQPRHPSAADITDAQVGQGFKCDYAASMAAVEEPPLAVDSNKILVHNVGADVRKSALRAEFEKFGPVQEVYIKAGRAFVTFESAEGVADAIREMDGASYNGEKLKVERDTRPPRGRGGGSVD